MTKTTVCVPWRAQPDRRAAFARVLSFWEHHGFDLLCADSKRTEPFNLARARNHAARKAAADIIVMADADTIPDIGAVHEAIDIAASSPTVVWPFQHYRHIPGDAVNSPDLHSIPADQTYKNSVGGIFVTSADTYWSLNGQDERFESRWGYDDSAFFLAAQTLAITQRLPGTIYSFNHSADRDMTTDNPNRARYELYRFANGKRDVMRELIKL